MVACRPEFLQDLFYIHSDCPRWLPELLWSGFRKLRNKGDQHSHLLTGGLHMAAEDVFEEVLVRTTVWSCVYALQGWMLSAVL